MKGNKLLFFLTILIIIGLGIIGYLGYQNHLLKKNKLFLESELLKTKADLASTRKDLEALIASLGQELGSTITERNDFELKYNEEKARMDSFSSQIEGIQSTVGTLEKLSQTDEELLKKYSKVYFLSENYIPRAFVKIEPKFTFDPKDDYLFYDKIWPFLQNMLVAADDAGVHLRIVSAYRSFGTQAGLKSSYRITYGSGANRFVADQGYSEHQLGTTLDFTTEETGSSSTPFDKTTAYQWLLDNAYRYGFILSYPEGNKYYIFEPWHWRFVGRGLAEKLHQEGKKFYDISQRDIDEYLVSFFD